MGSGETLVVAPEAHATRCAGRAARRTRLTCGSLAAGPRGRERGARASAWQGRDRWRRLQGRRPDGPPGPPARPVHENADRQPPRSRGSGRAPDGWLRRGGSRLNGRHRDTACAAADGRQARPVGAGRAPSVGHVQRQHVVAVPVTPQRRRRVGPSKNDHRHREDRESATQFKAAAAPRCSTRRPRAGGRSWSTVARSAGGARGRGRACWPTWARRERDLRRRRRRADRAVLDVARGSPRRQSSAPAAVDTGGEAIPLVSSARA